MSIILGLAAALAAPPATPAPDLSRDADLRCVAATALAIGMMGKDKSTQPQTLLEVTTVFMYFMGKVDGRHPVVDLPGQLRRIYAAPAYPREVAVDLKRCGEEAEVRGKALQDLGRELQQSAPIGEAPASRRPS